MISSILNDKVLIKLDLLEDHSKSESGLSIPLYEAYQTEGGRPSAKLSDKTYLAQGEVILCSPSAAKKLEEQGTPISIGQKVFVTMSSVSPAYQFFMDRSNLVLEFDGHILIPYTFIEAYVN